VVVGEGEPTVLLRAPSRCPLQCRAVSMGIRCWKITGDRKRTESVRDQRTANGTDGETGRAGREHLAGVAVLLLLLLVLVALVGLGRSGSRGWWRSLAVVPGGFTPRGLVSGRLAVGRLPLRAAGGGLEVVRALRVRVPVLHPARGEGWWGAGRRPGLWWRCSSVGLGLSVGLLAVGGLSAIRRLLTVWGLLAVRLVWRLLSVVTHVVFTLWRRHGSGLPRSRLGVMCAYLRASRASPAFRAFRRRP